MTIDLKEWWPLIAYACFWAYMLTGSKRWMEGSNRLREENNERVDIEVHKVHR